MKKLSLKTSFFQNEEVLSRNQLKKVLGGSGSGQDCEDECGTSNPCEDGKTCTIVDDREDCGHLTQRCF